MEKIAKNSWRTGVQIIVALGKYRVGPQKHPLQSRGLFYIVWGCLGRVKLYAPTGAEQRLFDKIIIIYRNSLLKLSKNW